MKHSKKETEQLISDIENISEFIIIKDPKLRKKLDKVFKKVRKEGVGSIMTKDGETDED